MDDADGPCKGALGKVDGHQHPAQNLIRNRSLGQNRNTDPNLERAFDRFDVVELHDVIDSDLMLLEDSIDRLARWNVPLESDEVLPSQSLDADTAATGKPMLRIAHYHQLVLTKWNDFEI